MSKKNLIIEKAKKIGKNITRGVSSVLAMGVLASICYCTQEENPSIEDVKNILGRGEFSVEKLEGDLTGKDDWVIIDEANDRDTLGYILGDDGDGKLELEDEFIIGSYHSADKKRIIVFNFKDDSFYAYFYENGTQKEKIELNQEFIDLYTKHVHQIYERAQAELKE